ncbi:MAG: SDR family oxidoreductase [Betaproteobacteria bacterium]|nr:MAG: SDR family oxidoreductase [Betaproteobacteria bacterium]
MNKVAIVTGSSSGIGAATALELSRRGWNIVVNCSKSADQAQEVAAQCREAIVVQADVGQDGECRRLAQAALEKWGRVDALVNNAGATKFVPHPKLEELSDDDFLRIYRVNVVAAFQMTRACAPALKAARGAVVNVSSLASFLGTGSSIAYAASKGALNTLTQSLARVLAPEVRVNAVLPGVVDTPWMSAGYGAERFRELAARYAANAPLKSTCRPEDIAETIGWLIEGARMTTGETVLVDAGFHLATPR